METIEQGLLHQMNLCFNPNSSCNSCPVLDSLLILLMPQFPPLENRAPTNLTGLLGGLKEMRQAEPLAECMWPTVSTQFGETKHFKSINQEKKYDSISREEKENNKGNNLVLRNLFYVVKEIHKS